MSITVSQAVTGGAATEAAVVAVVYGLAIGLFVYREISFKDLPKIFIKSAETSCVVMFIATTAFLFAWLITVKQLPLHIGDFLQTHIGSKVVFLVLLNIVLLIIGMFMESFSAIIVFMPILFPIAKNFGMHSQKVKKASGIGPALNKAFKSNKPALIEVTVNRNHPYSGSPAVGWWDVPIPDYLKQKRKAYEKQRKAEKLRRLKK